MSDNENLLHFATAAVAAVVAGAGAVVAGAGAVVAGVGAVVAGVGAGAAAVVAGVGAADKERLEVSRFLSLTSIAASVLSLFLTSYELNKKLDASIPLPEPLVNALQTGQTTKENLSGKLAPVFEKMATQLGTDFSELQKKFSELCKDAKIKGVKIEEVNSGRCATLLEQEPK